MVNKYKEEEEEGAEEDQEAEQALQRTCSALISRESVSIPAALCCELSFVLSIMTAFNASRMSFTSDRAKEGREGGEGGGIATG